MDLKSELKTAKSDIIRIMSELTFFFWLDKFVHFNDKRIQF